MAILLAFQFVRTKKTRLLPERINAQLREQVAKMGFDPARIKGLPELDDHTLKREHIEHQVRSLATYAQLIAEKQLFLIQAPEGSSFYVGDHPVVLHNDEEPRGMMGRHGLGAHYIQIHLPLSADVMVCAYDKAVIGQLMRTRNEGQRENSIYALGKLMRGEITASRMKQAMDDMRELDVISPILDAVRSGKPVIIHQEQVDFYNSLQVSQAHRFVVDPDGNFAVAREMDAIGRSTALRGAK